jgi:dipeptidyl aminopeptidase/acylaminoacyl peptidase
MQWLFLVISMFCLSPSVYSDEGKIEILQTESHETVEIFIQKSEKENAPFLLFLHGVATDAGLSSISKMWFDYCVKKGYSVGAISMPGYGKTSGSKDYCGPFTMKTLNTAIDAIKKELGSSIFGIIGFGQGAHAGLLLTTQRDDIRCLVCSNGRFDLLRHLHPDSELVKTLISKNYDLVINEEEFRIRSPQELVSQVKAPIFILQRETSPMVSTGEAMRFAASLTHLGKECAVCIFPQGADLQKITFEEILQETEMWVESKLNPSN